MHFFCRGVCIFGKSKWEAHLYSCCLAALEVKENISRRRLFLARVSLQQISPQSTFHCVLTTN